MPFDETDLTPALRRRGLIEALRAPLPKGVKFDFMTVSDRRGCGSTVCALGLAAILWPEHERVLLGGYGYAPEQAALFGITQDAAKAIFWGQSGRYTANEPITKHLVADHLDNEG